MTAQIPDTFIFKGEQHSLIGMSGGELASPFQFGMDPEMIHTACYRGYFATYELTDEGLFLRELTLREKNGQYLPIAGVEADKGEYEATYHRLDVLVPFTGSMRLAKDFIEELYIHMGFQKATAYKTVYDLTLEEGMVLEIKDRSEEVEQKRGAFKKKYGSCDLLSGIGEAFSLDMDLE